jgi:hypothetical protein
VLGAACDATGVPAKPSDPDPYAGPDSGSKELHRLSSSEYNATVQDVLGTKLEPATAHWRGGELGGFDNMASVLGVDEAQYDRYFEAARALAVELMATESQRGRFVPCALSAPDCVRSSIEAAGLRVFRRPLEASELETYERVYETARGLGDDEADAFTLSLRALLSSAEFLYRIELDPEPDAPDVHPLSAFELASRLSYFLWGSAPDDALLQSAAAGELASPTQLEAIVDRLLDDPKSERLVASFAGQWLGARQVLAHPTLPRLYEWTPDVARAAGQEMVLYFAEFLRSDRSWLEFPLADFNYADGALAKFYGIPTDLRDSGPLERFEFHDDRRAGFFGLAGFLAISSFDRRTSPSKRGDWIARNLLCAELPKPPPNVPQLDSEDEDTSALNVRQRLERHRADQACASCHALFDPYGLALEEYGPIGLYRSSYEDGTAVDTKTTLPASAAYPDGLNIEGLDGLARAVADDPRFGQCLATKLLTYGLGRVVTQNDEPHMQAALGTWLAPGQTPSIRRLLHALVATSAFRLRRGGR